VEGDGIKYSFESAFFNIKLILNPDIQLGINARLELFYQKNLVQEIMLKHSRIIYIYGVFGIIRIIFCPYPSIFRINRTTLADIYSAKYPL